MTYEGFLRIGGVEVVNTERVRGYTTTSDCPQHLVSEEVRCDALGDAVGDGDYAFGGIASAPWYDPSLADMTSRFYGVVGLSFSGLTDSTRSASRTEGVTDGGTNGRTRKGMRTVRVSATTLARGSDALDYGSEWLSSVFDGGCSQHGTACSMTDMEFFAACPPERGQVADYTPWVEVARNLVPNASLETAASTVDLHRNMIKDPDLVNLAVWSGTAGTTEVASGNRFKFISTGASVVRLGVSQTLDAKKAAGAHMLSVNMQALDPAFTTARVILLDNTGSIIRATTNIPIIAGGGNNRYDFALTATDVWDRVYIEFTGTAIPTGAVGYIGQPILGQRTVPIPFFSPGQGSWNSDLNTVWAGVANASESILQGNRASGVQTAVSGALVYQSTEWADTGMESVKVDPTGTSNASYGSVLVSGLTAGATYTAVAKIRLEEAQVGSLHATWVRQLMAQSTGMVVNNVLSNRAPNEPGVYELRVTFTLAAATTVTLFMMNGSMGTPVWFDSFGVFAGVYTGPYFSGSTDSTATDTYAWTGAVENSISTHEARQATMRPRTNEEYAELVNPLRRFLHDVAVVSGPISVEEFDFGSGFVGRRVEWTISSERAWVYGLLKELELAPTLPSLVQDVPFNLVPYPSAERVAGLNPNPTLAANSNGYSGSIAVVSGASPAGLFTTARTATMAYDGPYSWRGLLQGVTSGTLISGVARATLACEIDVSSITDGTLVEAFTWGRFGNYTGDAADGHQIQGYATWKTAGNVAVGSPVDLGLRTSFDDIHNWRRYGATTAKPATATKLVIELRFDFLWNSGGPISTSGDPTTMPIYMDLTDAAPLATVATNLSTNPSVETNATGWTAESEVVSGTSPAAFLTSGRSTDLAAAGGTASFRTRILGNNGTTAVAGAVSRISAYQDVAIPAGTGRRVSLNLWVACLILTGSAPGTVVDTVDVTYEFFNGAVSLGAQTVFGSSTTNFGGIAFSLTGLAVPATATLVRMRARARATWSSSATAGVNSDVRMYADALTVSIP